MSTNSKATSNGEGLVSDILVSMQAGIKYASMVFAVGFLLGSIRVPFLVPRIGQRNAELLEMPLMALVIIHSAHHIVHRYAMAGKPLLRMITGLVGLSMLLGVELSVNYFIFGRTLREYFVIRDSVSGPAYFALLGLFALMPYFHSHAFVRPFLVIFKFG